jgi:phosphonopyruvate decarboxylase
MGCAPALGLGLAMELPETEVVVVDGDGAALMRMGNFATVGAYGGSNFTHIVLDNEAHDSTGAQPTVSSGVRFAEIAGACGYRTVVSGDDPALVDRVVGNPGVFGPRLLHLKIRPGTGDGLPRPSLAPGEVAARFTEHVTRRAGPTSADACR